MRVRVTWELEVPDESVDKLVAVAIERECGDLDQIDHDIGRRELVAELMMDGGVDVIESALHDQEFQQVAKDPKGEINRIGLFKAKLMAIVFPD